MNNQTLDAAIEKYESGWSSMPEVYALFQFLVDSGMAWGLQGSYGRTAHSFMDAGHIARPKEDTHPEDTAVVAVRRGDTVLLFRRGPTSAWKPRWWNLPGGAAEGRESMRAAAVRELAEETGLVIEPGKLTNLWSKTMKTEQRKPWSFMAFVIDAPDGWEPTLCDENDQYEWCPVAFLPRDLVDPLPTALARVGSASTSAE